MLGSFFRVHYVSASLALPLIPLRGTRCRGGHVLSLYEERTQRRTKERNPRFPSLVPPLLRLFVQKRSAVALLLPNQSVDCKRFCFAKANQRDLCFPLYKIILCALYKVVSYQNSLRQAPLPERGFRRGKPARGFPLWAPLPSFAAQRKKVPAAARAAN